MGWLSFDKFKRLQTVIRWNGGFKQSLIKLWYYDDVKIGCLVGTDQFGNKYYENNNYFFGRNRWVEYSPTFGFDYDASMIPPEWFGWIHYRTDYRPCEDPTRPFYPWQKPHIMNLSGTPDEYVPYDTTRPKIEAWVPPKPTNNLSKFIPETKICGQTLTGLNCCPPKKQIR